jgi:hypothetical protein
MDDELTPAFFSPLVGTGFSSEFGPFVLDSLTEHAASPGAPRALPFSLMFLGASTLRLPQQIYVLQHPTAGELQLFLVPLGPRADGQQQFEAVFN